MADPFLYMIGTSVLLIHVSAAWAVYRLTEIKVILERMEEESDDRKADFFQLTLGQIERNREIREGWSFEEESNDE